MFKYILPTILLCCFALAETGKSYQGYKVLRLSPTTRAQAKWLSEFDGRYSVDFWSDREVMVSPQEEKAVIEELNTHGIEWEISIPDVQDLLTPSTRISIDTDDPFGKYNRYDEISKFLSEIEVRHPRLVSLSSIGNSTEGRPLPIIKISNDNGSQERPIILIDAGIHAREWITIAMALYIIQQLVEDTSNQDLLRRADWHIIPVLNPDGYEYSHTKSRLWRKTRSPQNCKSFPADPKDGVDGNRNFDFHWNDDGAHASPCSDEFMGPEPFSEPETRSLRDHVLTNTKRIKMYLTFHAYQRTFYYPWAYTSEPPANEKELKDLAIAANAAQMAKGGSNYTIGSVYNVNYYPVTGSMQDWVKGIAGVPLVFSIELPGSASPDGQESWHIPESDIATVVSTFFPAVRVMGEYVNNL